MKRTITPVLLILVALLLAVAETNAAQTSAIHLVTTNANSGAGSFRQALEDTDNGDMIRFDASLNNTNILLSFNLPAVDKEIYIDALGQNITLIGNSGIRSGFEVEVDGHVTIWGLSFIDGSHADGGGAFQNLGSLILHNVEMRWNEATGIGVDNGGGAIQSKSGLLEVYDSEFFSNLATTARGGAINVNSGEAKIVNTVFENNSSDSGGGVAAPTSRNAKVVIEGSLFDGNSAETGGGIYGYQTDLTIINSTFDGNDALGGGGVDLWGDLGDLLIQGSTFINNTTVNGGALALAGDASKRIINSTFTNNEATGNGSAIFANGARFLDIIQTTMGENIGTTALTIKESSPITGSLVNIFNSVIGNNSIGDCSVDAGSIVEVSHSLIEDGGCITAGVDGNLAGISGLGTLGDYGGTTQTVPLAWFSPAIEAGDPAQCETIDQRGRFRDEMACDMGAFEYQAESCAAYRNGTVYHGNRAIQNAVDAASTGDLIRVAGTCSDVYLVVGFQHVAIDLGVTIEGGHTPSNWLAAPDPILYPTVLDALSGGRVITVDTPDEVKISHLTIRNGSSPAKGGGIFVTTQSTVRLLDCVVEGNSADTDGGGIQANGNLLLRRCLIYNNSAGNSGGGLSVGPASERVTLSNITFSENSASSGGAISNTGNDTELSNVTIYNNSSGVYNTNTLELSNLIVAGSAGADCAKTGGSSTILSYSLVQDGSCHGGNNGNMSGNPLLQPLSNNGGYSKTFALGDASPARNSGDNTTCANLDQRNEVRNDGACDLGAYESDSGVPSAVTLRNLSTKTDGSWLVTVGLVIVLWVLTKLTWMSFWRHQREEVAQIK